MSTALITLSSGGLSVTLDDAPTAAIAAKFDTISADLCTALPFGHGYWLALDAANIADTDAILTTFLQTQGLTVIHPGDPPTAPIDWLVLKTNLLGNPSFTAWATAAVTANPGLAIAFISMNAAIDAENVDGVKAAYWQIIQVAPPTAAQATEWQGILNSLGITALRFA